MFLNKNMFSKLLYVSMCSVSLLNVSEISVLYASTPPSLMVRRTAPEIQNIVDAVRSRINNEINDTHKAFLMDVRLRTNYTSAQICDMILRGDDTFCRNNKERQLFREIRGR